jgi:phosphatidylserine decarboxylase
MLPLTRHGWREMLVGTIVLAAAAWGLWLLYLPLALIIIPVWLWLIAFFRDPHRPIPGDESTVVSPADGKVSDITEIPHEETFGGPAVRVGIFLSVFNVHVNRSPCRTRVVSVVYKRGKFINAMSHNEASTQNESNTIVLAETNGNRNVMIVKQIVGLIARRIVCTVAPGDIVTRGQRIGMIKFGSRTELTIAKFLDPKIQVSIGQTVRGAASVIATLGKPISTEAPLGADARIPKEMPA